METQEVEQAIELTAELSHIFSNKEMDVVLASLAFCVAASAQMLDMPLEEFLERFVGDVRSVNKNVFERGREVMQ